MAESISLAQGQSQQDEREREFARLNRNQVRDQAKTAQRTKSQADRGRTRVPTSVDPTQLANVVAQQAYTRGWQYTQELLEDAALSFADLMLFTGPTAVAMYLLRLGGTLYNGFGEATFRGISVKRVPGYGWVEGTYRSAKILVIGLFSGFVWATLTSVIYFITHPLELIKLAVAGFTSIGDIVATFGTALVNGFFSR